MDQRNAREQHHHGAGRRHQGVEGTQRCIGYLDQDGNALNDQTGSGSTNIFLFVNRQSMIFHLQFA